MDNILYESLSNYFHALELKGYMPYSHAQKLLLLVFYRDFTLKDYRGLLSKDDYHLIERALDCLWGSSCLIPYPDYLKMSKLCLGRMTELVARTKAVEDSNANMGERLDDHDTTLENYGDRISAIENTKVIKEKDHITSIPDINLNV